MIVCYSDLNTSDKILARKFVRKMQGKEDGGKISLRPDEKVTFM